MTAAPRHATPPQFDEAGMVAFLGEQSDIAAAWLFGSLATGKGHPRSDVDVAVLLNDRIAAEERFGRRLHLASALERFADREVDVIVMNDAPLLLQMEVLKHGRLLVECERQRRVNYELYTGKVWTDMAHHRAFFRNVLIARAREGSFGERRYRHPVR